MAKATVKDILTGSDVKVFFDGEEIATFTSIEATISVNTEDVQIGMDVMAKAVSWQGEGTLNHQATNSIGAQILNKIKANRDVTFTIEAELTKPSTGETQFTSFPNCTITEIPLLAWSKGELVESEIPFRFAPSEVQNTQLID
jgi:hypothetical protein